MDDEQERRLIREKQVKHMWLATRGALLVIYYFYLKVREAETLNHYILRENTYTCK